jgi:hypothetical protein
MPSLNTPTLRYLGGAKLKPVLIGLYSSDMRSGKSTVASMLTERFFGLTQSFAAPLYDTVISIAGEFLDGGEPEVRRWLSDERKDKASIPGLSDCVNGGVTLRWMLQTLGTQWGRDLIHPHIWTMLAEQKALKALKSYSVIFDDMRFPDEFEMVKRNGGKAIRIFRPGEGTRGDTSIGEGLLDNHAFDFNIYNVGTLEHLKRNVWYVADLLGAPERHAEYDPRCCHKTVVARCKGCPYA